MTPFLQDAGHVMTHDPRLRVGDDNGSTQPFDQPREILRRPGISGRERHWIACAARRARERDLSVGDQLLVVLQRIVASGSFGCTSEGSCSGDHVLVRGFDREQRRDVPECIGVGVGIRVVAVRNQRAREDRRVCRDKVTEPRRPGAIVRDPAKARNQLRPTFDVSTLNPGFSLVNHGLIDHVAWNPFPPYFFAGIWNCTYIWPIVI
jgi:hypothetical protein